jgi:hypothetical protein
MFDNLFFKFVDYYKPKYKMKARKVATLYITFLQISLVFVLGVFFAKFFNQLNVDTMSSSNAWTLFTLTCIGLYFKNWMQYAGKRLTVKKAKKAVAVQKEQSVLLLWLLPLGLIALALVLLNAL